MPFLPDQIKALKQRLADLDEERATIQRMLAAAEKRLDPPYAPTVAPPVIITFPIPYERPHLPAPQIPAGGWPQPWQLGEITCFPTQPGVFG